MWQMQDYPLPQQWPVPLAEPSLSHHADVKARMESTILLQQIRDHHIIAWITVVLRTKLGNHFIHQQSAL